MSRPILLKIGGALLDDPAALDAFWTGVRALSADAPCVVVHGGGPQATSMARRLDHTPRIVQGRRVTTDVDLDIMLWTVRGALNGRLVAAAQRHDLPAFGLSGLDGALVRVRRRPPWHIDGESVDFGWVGDVVAIQTKPLATLLDAGYLPVVAPLCGDGTGHVYNVNADTVAQALAIEMDAASLLLVTESGGVRRDADVPGSHLHELDRTAYEAGVRDGWIAGGMQVKLKTAFDALGAGVPDVCLLGPTDLTDRTRATRLIA